MKKLIFFALVMLSLSTQAETRRYNRMNVSISLQTFYDELSPYGDWLYTPEYGYVWQPYFDRYDEFTPYSTGGRWVNTMYGWTWVSDYRWGWAPFHYGRWYYDNYFGWLWVPGYEWGPAWVSWGSYNDYWGWAPLGPRVGVSINIGWNAPASWWTFVPRHRFCSNDWYSYRYHNSVNITNINYITNIYNDNRGSRNNWYYGPRTSEVERYGNTRVRTLEVSESRTMGNARIDNNRVSIYRPQVEANSRQDARPVEYRNMDNARRSGDLAPRNSADRGNNDRAVQNGSISRPVERSANTPREAAGRDNGRYQQMPDNRNAREINRPQTEAPTRTYEAPARRQQEAPVYDNRRMERSAPVQQEQQIQRERPVVAPSREMNTEQRPTYQQPSRNDERPVYQQRSESRPVYQQPSRSDESPVYQQQQRSEPRSVYQQPSRSESRQISAPDNSQNSNREVRTAAPERSGSIYRR